MKEKIVVPFAPILVESTRSIGYSFESALADIIDNSIGKNATEVNIEFSSKEPQYVAMYGRSGQKGQLIYWRNGLPASCCLIMAF